MTAISNLIAAGLIEKDTNNEILWTWSYPSVTTDQCALILKKCSLESDNGLSRENPFIYGHYQGSWYYLLCTELQDADILPKVKQFVLVLWTSDFNPEKYEVLSCILSKTYSTTGNPAFLLQSYLSVLTSGSCTTKENGIFLAKDFNQMKAFLTSPVKHVINTFKLETILIYTAIILKKRIVIYHHQISHLQYFLRALPAFAWHRQNWQILYPYQDLVEAELQDLKGSSYYIAGFLDATVESRTDLYDLFINLAAMEMSVASHAKEAFAMSKIHKEIALFLVHLAEDPEITDEVAIKEIANKTKELLNSLKSFHTEEDGKYFITLETLKEKKMAPALENFLFNLAAAENMIRI